VTSLLGKILIVLIFVMSLVFMSFAVSLYATHQNLREVVLAKPDDPVFPQKPGQPLGLKYQLQGLRKENQDWKDAHARLQTEIKTELQFRTDELVKLKDAYTIREEEQKTTETERVELKKQLEEQVVKLTAEGKDLKKLTEEVDNLRAKLREVETKRDANFKKFVALTDEIVQAEGQLALLKERSTQLTAEVATQAKVLKGTGQ